MNGTKIIAVLAMFLVVLIALAVSTSFLGNLFVAKLEGTSVAVSPARLVWGKTFGGSSDNRAFYAITAGDGYLVVGSSKSNNTSALVGWSLRLDNNGNAVWNNTFFEGSGIEIRYATNLTDGFLIVGNEFLKSGDVLGYVARISDEGTVLWSKVIGEEKTNKLFSAIATTDGFALLGLSNAYGNGVSEAWVVKIDAGGNTVWNKTFANSADTAARAGVLAPDGDYMVAGYAASQDSSNYNFLLMKLSSTGEMIWNKTYGDQESQKAYSMVKAADGYVIVGDAMSPQTNIDAWVVKINFDGDLMWAKTVGGKDADSPSFITPSNDGSYLVAGFTFSFGEGNRDFWLFKIDNSGKILWSCTQGDEGYQEAYSVIQTPENQYVMVGWTDPPGQSALIGKAQYEIRVVKIESPQESNEFAGLQYVFLAVIFGGILLVSLAFVKMRKKPKLIEGKQSREPKQVLAFLN